MLAIGDMFYLGRNCSLSTGWYIVKGMPYGTTYFGRVVFIIIINMTDGLTYRTHLGPLSNIQERYSRSDLEVHTIDLTNLPYRIQERFSRSNFGEGIGLLQRYFELMVGPERINWIVEGF